MTTPTLRDALEKFDKFAQTRQQELGAVSPEFQEVWDAARTALAAQPDETEISFNGYKGYKNVRWYINELDRIRIVNQWIADVYCSKLREFFTKEYRQHGEDDRSAARLASNAISALVIDVKASADRYLRPGAERPDNAEFDRLHDAVTKRLLSGFPDDEIQDLAIEVSAEQAQAKREPMSAQRIKRLALGSGFVTEGKGDTLLAAYLEHVDIAPEVIDFARAIEAHHNIGDS